MTEWAIKDIQTENISSYGKVWWKLNENMISVNSLWSSALGLGAFKCQGEDGNPVQALLGKSKDLQADWCGQEISK